MLMRKYDVCDIGNIPAAHLPEILDRFDDFVEDAYAIWSICGKLEIGVVERFTNKPIYSEPHPLPDVIAKQVDEIKLFRRRTLNEGIDQIRQKIIDMSRPTIRTGV